MKFTSTNPYNGKLIANYTAHTTEEMKSMLDKSQLAFQAWRKVAIPARAKLMRIAGEVLRENVEEYAQMISSEMGKPISESRAEVTKCAWVCDYYAENTEAFLANEIISTDASQSFVKHEPIGCVLAVMPWNFPFWQVFLKQN